MNLTKYKIFGFSLMLVTGIVLAFAPIEENQKKLHEALKYNGEAFPKSQCLMPETVANWIIDKDPSIQIIDIRSGKEFSSYNIPGSINIPMEKLSSAESSGEIYEDKKIIIAGQNSTQEQQAWKVLKQLGYHDICLIKGGIENWLKCFDKPQQPEGVYSTEDENLYQFRLAASPLMMGRAINAGDDAQVVAKPKPAKRRKKRGAKKADEGC